MYRNIKAKFNLAHFGGSLKARALRGSVWLGAGSVAEQSVRFARNLILVRWLAPSAFGTMAIVLSVTSVLTAFTEVGVREALIQNPRGSERRYVESAWWMAFGRALATYFLLFLAAPWVARFYGNPDLSRLLRVALVGLLFEGAISARAYLRLKEMKFSKWTVIQNGGGIAGIAVTVVLSFMMRNVWALVIGFCAESFFRCFLSYAICPFLPALKWDRGALRDLLRFSRKLFGMSVLYLVFLRADIFVLGKMFSPTDLGLYSMAVFLAQVPAGFLIGLMGQLLMPTLSEIQHDKARMNRIVLQVSTVIGYVGLPTAVLLLLYGRPLLAVVYGRAYAAAALPLAVAGCIALISMLNVQLTTVFYATGHPNLHRRCVAVMAVTVLLLVYPLAKWLGLLGGQVAGLIAMIAGFALQIERVYHVTGLRAREYCRIAFTSVVLSMPVFIVWLFSQLFLPAPRPVVKLACGVVSCFSAYAVAGWFLLRRATGSEARDVREPYLGGATAEHVDA